MEISRQNVRIKCDMPGCKNLAQYVFTNKTFFTNNTFNLCEDCVKQIYSWYGKQTTPKSPVNMLNRKNFNKKELKTTNE